MNKTSGMSDTGRDEPSQPIICLAHFRIKLFPVHTLYLFSIFFVDVLPEIHFKPFSFHVFFSFWIYESLVVLNSVEMILPWKIKFFDRRLTNENTNTKRTCRVFQLHCHWVEKIHCLMFKSYRVLQVPCAAKKCRHLGQHDAPKFDIKSK